MTTAAYDPSVPPPSPGVYELGDVKRLDVTFPSDGYALAGHVYLPVGSPVQGARHPAIVLDGPGSNVKELTIPVYAIKLARAGYLVLSYDRRGFGSSDGRLRNHVDTNDHMRDIRNAATYLLSREDVDPDRLAGVGVCAGGGFMLQMAAADRRFRAVATVAAAFSTMRPVRDALGHGGWVAAQKTYAAERLEDLRAGRARTQPLLAPSSAPEGSAAMRMDEAYNFYPQRQQQVAPSWENEATCESMDNIMSFDAIPYAPLVSPTPLLIVHGTIDEPTPPHYAQEVYDKANEPKKLVWIETTNHTQLYDIEPYVTQASHELVGWLGTHLAESGGESKDDGREAGHVVTTT